LDGSAKEAIFMSSNSINCRIAKEDEVLCDFSPLEVFDVILGQPYMWKFHVVYGSNTRSIVFTFGGHLYKVTEVVMATEVSLILEERCHKVISQTRNFFFFMVWLEGEKKVTTTTTTSI
jgi:hypothetical protein